MATELAKAYVQIIPSAKGIQGGIAQALGGDGEAEKAGATLGGRIASTIKKVIAAAGIGTALKMAISEGAELEQSLGGIDTLYGQAAEKVKQLAADAYASAGLSANDYMQTVSGFSASLRQSLGGDMAAVADVGHMAVVDMADNANKMGTSMQSIQDAYQGFAKQNYTMLDNLKLGYGGTKSEMQRLLADATKLSGVKYDISNLADVYSAIHVIQGELGITGATAQEAATTFTGSMAAMKSALSNVLGNLALGEDVGPALSALASTVTTFLVGNLIPMVWNIVSAVPGALFTFVGELIPENLLTLLSDGTAMFRELMTQQLPQFLASGAETVIGMANGALQALPHLLLTVGALLERVLRTIWDSLPQLVASGVQLVGGLAQGLWDNMPAVLSSAAQVLSQLLFNIYSHLPQLLQSGISLLGELAAGLIRAIPSMVAKIPQIIRSIKEQFDRFNWGEIGTNIITGIAHGIINAVGSLVQAAIDAAMAAFNAAKAALGIHSPSTLFEHGVGEQLPAGAAIGVEKNTGVLTDAIRAMTDAATDGLSGRLEAGLARNSAAAPGRIQTENTASQTAALLAAILEAIRTGNEDLLRALLADQILMLNDREFGRRVREAIA